MSTQKTRKLLYPVGLISLSLLSLLCVDALYQQFLNKPAYALEVVCWGPADTAWCPSPRRYVNEKFTKMTLTGGAEDKIKLAYAQVAIRELIQEKDSTLGIEFTFTNNAKYSSLVALYNLCNVENARSYVMYQGKFWVLNLNPYTKSEKTERMFYL